MAARPRRRSAISRIASASNGRVGAPRRRSPPLRPQHSHSLFGVGIAELARRYFTATRSLGTEVVAKLRSPRLGMALFAEQCESHIRGPFATWFRRDGRRLESAKS